ncbi:sensor domain-containing diguanylate cyclase [Pelobacter seleniigenes]|uniref:sensor domain-containing diguanylate cyclase n=1 Tax=Pelobacter seleniigenes TaxID=407188 RepID=UPI0004A6E986|nr:GGDEF domain-containing protein [Pelobacter seleniigenes]
MDLFQWNEAFEIGFSTIDEQHHHLFDVTNQFGVLLAKDGVIPQDTDALLEELLSYTTYHFREEEELMLRAGVDSRHIQRHQQKHKQFFQDVFLQRRQWSPGTLLIEKGLFEYLINWLIYHILGCDRNMARQIGMIEKGASAADAYQAEEQGLDVATQTLLKALTHLFNQVSDRNRQLGEFNQTLELKVEERTKALFEANQRLEKLSITDALTGLTNRRFAMQTLTSLWKTSKAMDLGCMLVDADNFKEINDTYGHDAGDVVLRELAKKLQDAMRTDDIVCRLGGDEFLIICPNTDAKGLIHVANQMHAQVIGQDISFQGGVWQGSISVGLALKTAAMETPEDLIKEADNGVYASKKSGRNCIRWIR